MLRCSFFEKTNVGCTTRQNQPFEPIPISKEPGLVRTMKHGSLRIRKSEKCFDRTRVSDPLQFNTDPDQDFHLMRIRIYIQFITSMRIRILFRIKVIRICDHWPTDPPGLNFEPPRLHSERHGPLRLQPRKLPEFWLNCESGSSFSLQCECGSGSSFQKAMRIHADLEPWSWPTLRSQTWHISAYSK